MIETGVIKISSKSMLSMLFMQYGISWFLIASAGFIIFLILGIVCDPRFFVLTLIWIFLVIPLVVAFLYFFYGMNPLTAFNSIPHIILFDSSDLRIRLVHPDENENMEPNDPSKDYIVHYSELDKIKSGGDYIILFFSKKGLLRLPVGAFDSFDSFKFVLENYLTPRQ